MSDAKAEPFFADVLDQVIDLAGDFAQSGGVRVSVKTNLGPAIPVFSGGDAGQDSAGIAQLLGLKAGVIVTDRDGKTLAKYGNPPPTEPIKVVLLVVLIGVIGFALVRGVLPRK